MERLPANFSAVPQGSRPYRTVHAVSPVPRGLSLLKGVIGNAAEMLHRAPVNI